MSESKIRKQTLNVFIMGLIVGILGAYMILPSQQTVVEVIVSDPGDPVTVEKLQEEMSGLTTLVYGAIGASLISALAAIVSLKQISTRMI